MYSSNLRWLLIAVAASAAGCSQLRHPAVSAPALSEAFSEEAGEREAYDLKRLCDPQTGKIPEFARQRELAYAATMPSDRYRLLSRSNSPVTFTSRGPNNVGGRTRAFGVDISNPQRILAGSCSGGMWYSENAGLSWTFANTAGQLKNATCLAQDTRPGHNHVWYYGSGEAYGASAGLYSGSFYLGDGLFKSTDSGKTWNPVPSTSSNNQGTSFASNWQLVWNIVLDPTAPDSIERLFAATYGGINKSDNGGKTWTTVKSGTSYFTDVAVGSTGVVYATLSSDGNQKGIWRSPDGNTWTNILPQDFPQNYKRIVIGIDPNNENMVYFLANTPGFGKRIKNYLGEPEYNSFYRYTYKSGDGTDTNGLWENLSQNLPATGTAFDKWQVQGSYDMVVKVKPGNSNVVFIGGTNLYRSTTAFNDSTHTRHIGGYEIHGKLPVIESYPNFHPDQHCVVFQPGNSNMMYSTNDGGVFRTADNSADSVVWESLNNGYLTTMFYTVAIDHATPGDKTIIGGTQDNGSWFTASDNPVAPWVSPRGGDGSYCAIADQRSAFYFSIQNGKMLKTTLDNQGNKTSFTRIDPIGLKDPFFINPFTLDPNDNNLMYMAGGKYLWKNDSLNSIPMISGWDSIHTGWTRWADSVPVSNVRVTAVHAAKTPADRVYFGTDNRRLYRIDNARNGTPKPIEITSNGIGSVFPSGAVVSCITTDPRDGNKLLIGFSNYKVYSLFYSEDSGAHWTIAGGNLEPQGALGPSIHWVQILPVNDGTIYLCATSTGLYATTALQGNKTEWVLQGAEVIGNAVCDMIDTRISDGLVVVATHANGIFSAHYTSVLDIVNTHDIATSGLKGILYPNPSNGSCQLKFEGVPDENIEFELWDECGRLLFSRPVRSTEYSDLRFDFSAYPSGIYYYTLKNRTRSVTQILIMQK